MEAAPGKKYSKLKLVLAGIGVVYLIGGGVWAGTKWWESRNTVKQPNLAAHPERAGEMLLDREVDKFNEQIGLSAEQKKQVHDIIEKAGVTNVAPLQAMQGMMEARKKIREILSPEQQEKMGKAEGDRVGKFADRQIDRLKKEVGITDEQEKGIRNIMNEANPMRAGADTSVSMPMRFIQARDRIRTLLTPEQQEKFDKMQGPGGGMLRRFLPGGGQPPQEEN